MASQRGLKLISNIDVSAFASIMVVLVAIFIFRSGAHIDLPSHPVVDLAKVTHPILIPHASREDAITIVVKRNGDIFFGNDFVHPYRLSGRIRESVKRGSEPTIYIRADARCKYRGVKDVLDEIHSSGVEHVVFLVDQRKPQQ